MTDNSVFTIEDIHRIRCENYEVTKNMLPSELIEKTKKEATLGWSRLAELKQDKNKT